MAGISSESTRSFDAELLPHVARDSRPVPAKVVTARARKEESIAGRGVEAARETWAGMGSFASLRMTFQK
jgi:hypothetical protein